MTTLVLKPVVLDSDGVFGQLPDNSIINAGGAGGPNFTVGDKGLLFDDGTSTAIGGTGITLQKVYDNTPNVGGEAILTLAAGKDFTINDSTNNGTFFKVSADDSQVVINGELIVTGGMTTINTVVQDSDHWLISPSTGTVTALSIQPDQGVTPLVDLVAVRRLFGSSPVFRIDSSGNLIATQSLTVNGLINGVNVASLNSEVQAHIDGTNYKHPADDITITPISALPSATNVQEALETLSNAINPNVGSVNGYNHIQSVPSASWAIVHNGGTKRVTVAVYDSLDEQIIPEKVKIVDSNSILVSFGTAVSGNAIVLLF